MLTLVKGICLLWVFGSLWIGLLSNGKRVYGWVGNNFETQGAEMGRLLDLMFLEVSDRRLRQYYVAYLLLLFGIGMFVLLPAWVAGVGFGAFFVVVGWKLPVRLLHMLFRRRVKKFVLQMVDGLSLMSNAMRSGLNVPQALELVVAELPAPIAQEFGLVLSQNKLGVSLEDAISNLSVRLPHDDVEMFTTSLNILKETGGNLAETFDTIAYTIRERIKVESKISAMVSQGVMQGIIVVLMPFALGAILYTIDPERIRPMFTTIPGWILLVAMMILQALGGWTIWKIIQVKV